MLNKSRDMKKGFTLVELMLAMTFFSSMLLLCSATFVQMLGVYNKGVAIKQMNQAGRTLTDTILRSGNSGAYSAPLPASDSAGRIHCMQFGSITYLLSYADDEKNPDADAYYLDATATAPKTLVNFVRYNLPGVSCPPNGGIAYPIDPDTVSSVIGATIRVYDVGIEDAAANGTITFRLSLGTFAGVDEPSNVQFNAGKLSCPSDSIGNFCAFSTYKTVLYVPTNSF